MFRNQSWVERSEAQRRKQERPGSSAHHMSFPNADVGKGGAAAPPVPSYSSSTYTRSSSGNRSYKKSNGQGGQSRVNLASGDFESIVVRTGQNGTPGSGLPDSGALPESPPSQTTSGRSDSAAPATLKGDVTRTFPFQFGTINPCFMNINYGMQRPGFIVSTPDSCKAANAVAATENTRRRPVKRPDSWKDQPENQNKKEQRYSLHSPSQMMHRAGKKYVVGKVEEAKQKRLRGILKKLMPQNFDILFVQIQQINIDNVVTLTGFISQIFDKALMEPTRCEMYANLCFHLASVLPDFIIEDNEKITFKRLLLNKCQLEFERKEAEANRVEEDDEVKPSEEDREEKMIQARRRNLGNILFLGELYKKKMLTETIMHECINKLLDRHQNPDEEDVEGLCKLMSSIGEIIDHPKAKKLMDAYFERIQKLSNDQNLSSRLRFMLKGVIDLRENGWQQRGQIEQVKEITIDNAVITLANIVSLIFDKALMEPTLCEKYANLCFHLAGELPEFSWDNEKITFKRLLLNKCQEEFERKEAAANRVEEDDEVKPSEDEREEKMIQARRRNLGNILFLGELYKKKMLTERIMHECIKKLLGRHRYPDEEDVEGLCILMNSIGETIDHPRAKEHMDAYFERMQQLSKNQKLSSRVRFMLEDVIELRKNRWQPPTQLEERGERTREQE